MGLPVDVLPSNSKSAGILSWPEGRGQARSRSPRPRIVAAAHNRVAPTLRLAAPITGGALGSNPNRVPFCVHSFSAHQLGDAASTSSWVARSAPTTSRCCWYAASAN